jgi:uncharacterized membrane protein YiaA
MDTPNTPDDRIYRRRWWTLAVLSLSLVIIGLDNTVLNVALPTLQRTFEATCSGWSTPMSWSSPACS